MHRDEGHNFPTKSLSDGAQSTFIGDEENQERMQNFQLDIVFDHIREQKKINEDSRKIIDELQKVNGDLKKQLDTQNDKNEKQNELNRDLLKKIEELQSYLGNGNVFQSKSCNEYKENPDATEVQLLLLSNSTTELNSNDNPSTIQKIVVFEIPAFFCCFWRILYVCILLVAAFESLSLRHHSRLYYMAAIAMTLSTMFEMLVDKLNNKVKNIIFTLHLFGSINYFVYLEKFVGMLITVRIKSFIPFFSGGIILIISEIVLVTQGKNYAMPRILILYHLCHIFYILFQLLAFTVARATILSGIIDSRNSIAFLAFGIISSILFLLHPILMIYGLPINQSHNVDDYVENSSKRNSIDLSQSETSNSNDKISSIMNKNEMDEREETLSHFNETETITDILHAHQQRLEYLESQNAQRKHHFSFPLFRPQGLNGYWKTTAQIDPNVYTMIMLSPWTQKITRNRCKNKPTYVIIPRPSKSWILGFVVFIFQTTLAYFTLVDQMSTEFGDTSMNIPFRVTSVVRVGQFITLILAVGTQTDLLVSFRLVLFLWYSKKEWVKLVQQEGLEVWLGRILLPNLMNSFQALLVLVTIFLVIVQSDNIVDLLKDFTALLVISKIDDMFFFVADYGYLGESLSRITKKTKQIVIDEDDKKIYRCLHLLSFVLLFSMFGGWMTVVLKQRRGSYLIQKYPECPSGVGFDFIGDGKCDNSLGVATNVLECGHDGGDCDEFNLRYPNCRAYYPYLIGDGRCDYDYNREECGYDGDDCVALNNELHVKYPNCNSGIYPPVNGDGFCHINQNREECGFDGGDCIEMNKEFNKYPRCKVKYPFFIGDGICHGGEYITEECGFDGGDCASCKVDDLLLLGNGQCDGGRYNTKECGFDFGDCLPLNYPDCIVDAIDEPNKIGNGFCDNSYNTPECGYDGGDCEDFNKKYPKCKVDDPVTVGDGFCNPSFPYNTKECGFDGGDCRN